MTAAKSVQAAAQLHLDNDIAAYDSTKAAYDALAANGHGDPHQYDA